MFFVLSALVALAAASNPCKFPGVALKDVPVILLDPHGMTTACRTTAIRPIQCEGSGCHLYYPGVKVMCKNEGGYEPIWRCEFPDLPSNLKISKTEVICEGYSYPEDPLVTAGSCGLVYQVVQHYAPQTQTSTTTTTHYVVPTRLPVVDYTPYYYDPYVPDWVGYTCIFIIFVFIIACCNAAVGGSGIGTDRYYHAPPPPVIPWYHHYYRPAFWSGPSFTRSTTTTTTTAPSAPPPQPSSAPAVSFATTKRR